MTTLREEDIEHFPTWEAVIGREGYVVDMDPQSHRLSKVIGKYDLPDQHPCGLANCHQPHLHGWVVLADGGKVTNLGSHCGPRHFPELEGLRREFNTVNRSKQAKERLREWKRRAPELLQQLEAIQSQPYGLSWLYKMIKSFCNEVSSLIASDLRMRANRGDPLVYVEERRSQEEIAEMVARGERAQNARFKQTMMGRLAGIEIFASANNLNRVVGHGIRKPLEDICDVSEDASVKSIQAAVKAADEAERALHRLHELPSAGLAFFKEENMSLLQYLALNDADRKKVQQMRVQLEPPLVSTSVRSTSARGAR